MKSPVFVLGAPRSGTTLLYHMLVSSGQFADYRAETHVFNLLGPKFGDLAKPTRREQLLDVWLRSFQFQRSGLNAKHFMNRTRNGFTTPGEFLQIFMEQLCETQGVERWAECTPEHLLYMKQIKREIPDAKVIHIIRDGRDVALSERRLGWVRPLRWDSGHKLTVSGLYWEWIVRKGRRHGSRLAHDYMEVRFEDLVETPRTVLSDIGNFIGQTLDYDFLLENAVGTLAQPNTSFKNKPGKFSPIARWKTELDPHELKPLESAILPLLRQLGYQANRKSGNRNFTVKRLRACYPLYFTSRLWLKTHTPLGRLTNIGLIKNSGLSTLRHDTPQAVAVNAKCTETPDVSRTIGPSRK